MKDNVMRNATETQEGNNGGTAEIWDNGDDRQGQPRIQRRMSTVVAMRDNMDGYGGGGDAGQKQERGGTTEMAKWIGRTATDWEISTGKDYQPERVSLLR